MSQPVALFHNVVFFCFKADLCRLTPEPGLCLAYFPRFYYNRTTETCEEFIYGGCGGNRNNFRSETKCLTECKGILL